MAWQTAMPYLHNQKQYKQLRRHLRATVMDGERRLWAYLRKRSFRGWKFRRQHSIGNYIVDFYCPALRLVVEVDGGQHTNQPNQAADNQRERFLVSRGMTIIRFSNYEVMKEMRSVLEKLEEVIDRLTVE